MRGIYVVFMYFNIVRGNNQCCGSAQVSVRIRIQIFYLNVRGKQTIMRGNLANNVYGRQTIRCGYLANNVHGNQTIMLGNLANNVRAKQTILRGN